MPKLTRDELDAYADFGRNCIADGLGYKAIRRRLETDHHVTGDDSTMRCWVASLKRPAGAMPRKRPASMIALVPKTIQDLHVYDQWLQQKMSDDEDLTYRTL